MAEKNPDFRFNRMRKSGKTEFFEVHKERALITHLITMLFATFFIFVTYMRTCTIPRNKHTAPFSRCEGELSDCFLLNKVRNNWLFSCLLMPKKQRSVLLLKHENTQAETHHRDARRISYICALPLLFFG